LFWSPEYLVRNKLSISFITENIFRWVPLLHSCCKMWQGTHMHVHIVVRTCVRAYIHTYIYIYIPPPCRYGPTRAIASSFLKFLDHTQRRTTIGRTPLDEWSARRRHLYLTTHNTRITTPLVAFEPTIPASKRPQTQHTHTFFLNFITQKCSNLSEDIQQQCWREVIVTCRGYIQWCIVYECAIKYDCLCPLGFSLGTS
jgi:hypothetical protein